MSKEKEELDETERVIEEYFKQIDKGSTDTEPKSLVSTRNHLMN